MKPVLRASLWLSAVLLCSIASADGLSLKRIPKTGDAFKYTMKVDFEANGVHGTIQATLLEQLTEVDIDGNYTVQQTQIEATGTYDGENFDVPARPPISMTYKPNRQVSGIKGTLVDENAYRVENLATILDPGKLVNVGDIWAADIKADKVLGTKSVRLEYKLVSEEKVGGVDTIKIKGTGKEQESDNSPRNEFTIWLSKTDGSIVQSESKWTNAPFPGITSPVSATIKITRVAA